MPDYRETVKKLRTAQALPTFGIHLCVDTADGLETCRERFSGNDAVWCRNCCREADRDDALRDALTLLTEQESELATLRQEITDLRAGPLSSWSQTVGILGGDEYDLGPELAKQRMDELATLRAENNSPWDFDAPDDELLPIRKCVCGATFDRWAQTISIYADDPTEMPCCKRKVYFTQRITVQETNR